MSSRRLTLIPPPIFSQAPGIGASVLPLLLGAAALFTAGCGASHHVSRAPTGYGKITAAASGETARVHLRDDRPLRLRFLHVGGDSTTGVTPRGNERAVPTSTVEEIEVVNRRKGLVQGIGIGALSTVFGLLGNLVQGERGPNEIRTTDLFVVLGVLTAPLGGIIGWVKGAEETYRFSNSSSEADSVKAALETRSPETQHRATEPPERSSPQR